MIGVSTYCVDGIYIIIATFYLEEEKEGKMLMRLCTFIFFFEGKRLKAIVWGMERKVPAKLLTFGLVIS